MGKRFKQLVQKILETPDSPKEIALGAAIGIFMAWTPTVGVQMIGAGMLATFLGASRKVAIPMVWISNPYTMVPIYWSNYRVGYWLIGGEKIEQGWLMGLLFPKNEIGFWEYVKKVHATLLDIGGALWLGSTIIGLLLSVICYFVLYRYLNNRRVLKTTGDASKNTPNNHFESH